MKVRLYNYDAKTVGEIESFEQNNGIILPTEYSDFIKKYNGALVGSNYFIVNNKIESKLNKFVSLNDIVRLKMLLIDDFFTKEFIPVAIDVCGNYVLLLNSGDVYFFEHEEPLRKYKIADTFSEFLNSLQEDNEDVDVDPDNNIGSWIDPDFLKLMIDKGNTKK